MQFQLALRLHKYLILNLLTYTKRYLDLGYRPKKTGNFCRETNDDFGLFAVSSGCRGAQPKPRSFLTANGPEWTRIPNRGEQRTTHTNSFTQVAVRRSPLAGDSRLRFASDVRPATFTTPPSYRPRAGSYARSLQAAADPLINRRSLREAQRRSNPAG
jgi:hypothetical protein